MEKQTESKQRKALTLRQKRNMVYFVEATEKILKEEGIPGVTIRRIAAEAGYNSATLYNYFQDLDELILFGSVCFLRDYLLDLSRNLQPEIPASGLSRVRRSGGISSCPRISPPARSAAGSCSIRKTAVICTPSSTAPPAAPG